MNNLFNLIGGWNLVLSVVIVTVIVSAITTIFEGYFCGGEKKLARKRKKTITVIIALFVALTNNTFVKGDVTLGGYVLTIMLTWSVAVLFYLLIGKWTIHRLVKSAKKYISGKLNVSN